MTLYVPRIEQGSGARRAATRALSNPWVRFAVRRGGRLLTSMWVLVTASFFMVQLVPGDPVRASLGKYATTQLVEARRAELGLDNPIWVQYVDYIKNLLHGELGASLTSQLPVSSIISQRFPATVEIALLGFVTIMVTAVPIGMLMAAFTRGGRRPRLLLGFTSWTVLLAAVPDFLFAVGAVWLFSIQLGWFPIAGRDGPASYVLPVLSLSIGSAAILARIVRVELLSVLGEDYVRTARAKRLSARLVYIRHALPNALTATLTIGGLLLAGLMAGTVLVENVFAWPGLGTVIVSSIQAKDYLVVQALVLVYGSMTLAINLVVDIVLALLDPRSTIREG